MGKNTPTEEYLIIADRHIEAVEQRIRRQKRRLFEMAGRGREPESAVLGAAAAGLAEHAVLSGWGCAAWGGGRGG
jgi:hypothetical protein